MVQQTILQSPLLAKAIVTFAGLTYVLSLIFPQLIQDFLTLIPGNIFSNFHLWTYLTAGITEIHLLSLLSNSLVIFVTTKWVLESLWNNSMLITFFVVVNVLVPLLASVIVFFIYEALFLYETNVLYYPLCGLSAFAAGMTVVVKQNIPDYPISIAGFSVRGKHIPGLYFAAAKTLTLVNTFVMSKVITTTASSPSISETLFAMLGIYVSWCYLRFFQRRLDGTVGDLAESFAFVSFFPSFLHAPISIVARISHRLFSRFGIIKKIQTISILPDSIASSTQVSDLKIEPSIRISPNPLVAQHRRELANRELDRILEAALNKAPATNNTISIPTPSSTATPASAKTPETPADDTTVQNS